MVALAKDPNTSPTILIELVDIDYNGGNSHWDYLTMNPNTPAEALVRLAENSVRLQWHGYYGYHIIKHPNTPTYLKQYLQAKRYMSLSK